MHLAPVRTARRVPTGRPRLSAFFGEVSHYHACHGWTRALHWFDCHHNAVSPMSSMFYRVMEMEKSGALKSALDNQPFYLKTTPSVARPATSPVPWPKKAKPAKKPKRKKVKVNREAEVSGPCPVDFPLWARGGSERGALASPESAAHHSASLRAALPLAIAVAIARPGHGGVSCIASLRPQ